MADAPLLCETVAEDLRYEAEREAEWAELAKRSLGQLSLSEVRDLVTKTLLAAALARVNYNYSRAAELLCVTRQSVQYLVVRHDIQPPAASRRAAPENSRSAQPPEL